MLNIRSAVVATTLLLTTTVLVGCQPTPAPSPTDDSPASSTPKPTVTQEQEVQLPADAVLGMTMRATADTGAKVDVQLVLLKPEAWDSANGQTRADATVAWCQGEVDEGVITAEGGYSFAQLDATVTPVDGTPAWPVDLPLHLFPGGATDASGPTLTAGGSAYSVQRPDDSGSDDPGYYVPHCVQDVFVPAPGTGSAYLGFGNDASTLGAWANSYYGATFTLFGEPVGTPRATLSDCAYVVTDLGKSLGGSGIHLGISDTECVANSGP